MRMPGFREIALAAALLVLAAGCGHKVDSKTKEGYELVTAGKLDEAIALANSVLADNPKHTGALNVLGLALYKSGDLPAAAATFQKALEIDPKHPEVHFNLGNVYLATKRFPEAEKEYDAAIKAQDKFVLARYNLGKVYEQTGRVDQALAQYRRAVDLDPQFFPAHMDIGKILETSGDIDGAITSYKRALELQPTIKELRVRLGNTYFKKGGPENLKQAEDEYRAAAGIDSTYVDALYSMGVVVTGEGREAEGAGWFRRALQASGEGADNEITRIIRRYFKEKGIPEEGPTGELPPGSMGADSAKVAPPPTT
jgi:tetratricopeptide (TPR) repeat protein